MNEDNTFVFRLVLRKQLQNGADEEMMVERRGELETNAHYFLQNVMSRLRRPAASDQIKVWDTACQDLGRLAQIDDGSSLAHGVQLLAAQLQCHLLVARVMRNSAWIDPSGCGPTTQDGDAVKHWIDQLQRLSLRLLYLFSNLSPEELLLVQSTRLQAMAVQLVYIVRASNTSALALSDHFVSWVNALKGFARLNKTN